MYSQAPTTPTLFGFKNGQQGESEPRSVSTGALLRWGESSSRNVGPLLERWLLAVRDPDSLQLLERSVASPALFSNQENWKALDGALRQWKVSCSTTTSEN